MASGTDFAALALRGLGALAMVALGVWLLRRARSDPPSLAFSIFLLAEGPRGFLSYFAGLAVREWSGELGLRLHQVHVVFAFVTEFAIVGFVLALLRSHLPGSPRVYAYGLVALALLVEGLYLYDPLLYADFYTTADGVARVSAGPLAPITAFPTFLGAAIVLFFFWMREPEEASRRSLFLVALGLLVYRLQPTTYNVTWLLGFDALASDPPENMVRATLDVGLLALVLALSVFAIRRPQPDVRRDGRIALAVVLGFIVVASAFRWTQTRLDNTVFFSAMYIAFPAIVLYGILRGRFFGLDAKARVSVRASTIAAVFLAIFLVVAEIAGSFFQNAYGWAFGGLAAGVAIVAIHPIQRVAQRVANAAVPLERAAAAPMAHEERLRMYREQARVAWADGALSADERRMLDAAREHLGLTHEEAASLEREAMPGA